MKGLHIIADFHHCPNGELLVSAGALSTLCVNACKAAGLSVLSELFHQFDSFDQLQEGGVTGAVVLAESHLAIHTWPERAAATLDVYVCNVSGDNSRKAEALYAELLAALKPGDVVMQRLWRGKNLDLPTPRLAVPAAA